MSTFQEDLAFSKKYRSLLAVFYQRISYEGRYVFFDQSRFSHVIQRHIKADVVIQKDAEQSIGIEEKIVKWPEEQGKPYTAFFLETHSCTNPGHEAPGWMTTCQADLLLYAFELQDLGLLLYLLHFPQLQRWFQPCSQHYQRSIMPNANRTEGRVVPILDVVKQVDARCYLLTFEGSCRQLQPELNIHSFWENALRRREARE